MFDRSFLRTTVAAAATVSLLCTLVPARVSAQSFSNAPTGVTPPAAPLPGPCFAPFSVDGDIYDAALPFSVPMGPPGCGLGWPGPPAPANIDAFSAGLSAALGLPLPFPPASLSYMFSVDAAATGDPLATCVAAVPGPYVITDVGAEAGGIAGGTTDAPADVFLTPPNPLPWGGAPAAPGSAPNFQAFDGDGLVAPPFGLPVGGGPLGPAGLVEPGPASDDVDAWDAAPIVAYDFAPLGGDSVPDLPVYFSVDAATAAAAGVVFGGPVGGAEIFVTVGGGAAIYAFAGALALGPADDVDALIVLDALGDGVYAPPADVILYSVTPASGAIGAPDCTGIPIEEGDLLTEGTPLGFAGVPCIVVFEEDIGLWSAARLCGPNPITGGGGDNVDAADLVGPAPVPPTTTTTSTTTTTTTTTSITTTTTTTTTLPALCGASPAAGCTISSVAGKSKVQIKSKGGVKDQFKWKFNKGGVTVTADFLDPVGSAAATYRVCLYDSTGKLMEMDIPPMGTCGTKPCWKATGTKGYKYKDKSATPDGIIKGKLKEGIAGKSQVQAKGKGSNLPTPALPLSFPVTVQLVIDDGVTNNCWQNSFTTQTKNDTTQVKAKGP